MSSEDDEENNNTVGKEARVRLELFASKLKNVAGAFHGTSDPYAVVTLLADKPGDKPRILGKTEVVKNSLSPHWTTHFDVQFTLGKQIRVNVGVYDEIRKAAVDKPMGSALFEIGEILASRGNIKAKKLRQGGTLFCRVTPVPLQSSASATRQQDLRLHLRAVECKATGPFGKPSPFLEISSQVRAASGLSWQALYRSDPILHTQEPEWPPIVFNLERLHAAYTGLQSGNNLGSIDDVNNPTNNNNGEDFWHTPIRIHVWDWHKSGKHRSMGRVETTVEALQRIQTTPKDDGVADGAVQMMRAMELKVKEKVMGRLVVDKVRIDKKSHKKKKKKKHHGKSTKSVNNDMPSENARSPLYSQSLSALPSKASETARQSGDGSLNMSSWGDSLPSLQQSASTTPKHKKSASVPYNPSVMPFVPSPPTRESFLGAESMPEAALGYDDLPPAMAPPPQRPQFVDYITGGCELELCIAIDFTGSNGDPRIPGTLHYMHDDLSQLNDYEKALTAVGGIIAKYDSDQKFPVWGFGAKYEGVIQHCFQIGDDEELNGIDGVLAAYRRIFRTGLTMSGPTVFEEVIHLAAAKARSQHQLAQSQGSQSYKILLILTDGAVSDVQATKNAIQAASDAPLSIVIVGIGDADFSGMQFLDDFQTEIGGGRDICQFVEFRKYQHDKSALTKQTLEEIPDQLVDFFYSRGIMPMSPKHRQNFSMSDVTVEEPTDQDVDLDLAMDERGEMYLTTYNGCMFDDTQYNMSSPSAPYNSSSSSDPPSSHAPAPAPAAEPTLFYVQVPAGVFPGTHLKIHHPITMQELVVTVPQGVGPGDKFGVRY